MLQCKKNERKYSTNLFAAPLVENQLISECPEITEKSAKEKIFNNFVDLKPV